MKIISVLSYFIEMCVYFIIVFLTKSFTHEATTWCKVIKM